MKITHSYRITIFIILSLMFHLAWLVSNQVRVSMLPQQNDEPFAVYIKQSTTAEKPTRKVTNIAKTSHDSSSSDHNTVKKELKNNLTLRNKVLGQVRKHIQYHFVYPKLALRQGLQGKVLLGFEINHLGNVHKAHIKKSSGYQILDDSALEALNQVGQLDVDSNELSGQLMEIPVIYRLEG